MVRTEGEGMNESLSLLPLTGYGITVMCAYVGKP